MSEREKPSPLNELDARLREARGRADEAAGRTPRPRGVTSGLGFALRIGLELVAALLVGGGIGLLLDRWLGTAPWLMLVFFLLGAAAGFLNVYRLAAGMDQSVGYRRDGSKDDGTKGSGPAAE